jgi:hypothetical protein
MKLFECQNCGQPLYFENTRCESCGRSLGYLPARECLSALRPDWLTSADSREVKLIFQSAGHTPARATGAATSEVRHGCHRHESRCTC